MLVGGPVSTTEEADEIELITQIFLVASRARVLAQKIHETSSDKE